MMDSSLAGIRSPLANIPAISPVRSKKLISRKLKLKRKSKDYFSSKLDSSSQSDKTKSVVHKSILDSSDEDFSSEDDPEDDGYCSDDNYTADIQRVISHGASLGGRSCVFNDNGGIFVPETPSKRSSVLHPAGSTPSPQQLGNISDNVNHSDITDKSQDKGFLSGFLSIVGNQISSIGTTVKGQVNNSIQSVDNGVDTIHHNNKILKNESTDNSIPNTADGKINDENGNLMITNNAVRGLHFTPVLKDSINPLCLEDDKKKSSNVIDTLGQGNLSLSDFLEPKGTGNTNNSKTNFEAKSETTMDSNCVDGITIGASPSKIITSYGFNEEHADNKIIGMPQQRSSADKQMPIPATGQMNSDTASSKRNSRYATNNYLQNINLYPDTKEPCFTELGSEANKKTLVNELQNLKNSNPNLSAKDSPSFYPQNKIETPPNEVLHQSPPTHLSPPAPITKTPSFLVTSVSNNNSLQSSPVNYKFQNNVQSISTPASPSNAGAIQIKPNLGGSFNKLSTIQQGVASGNTSLPLLSSSKISKSSSTSKLISSAFPSKCVDASISSLLPKANDILSNSNIIGGKSLSFSRNSLCLPVITGINGNSNSITTRSRSNSRTESRVPAPSLDAAKSQSSHQTFTNKNIVPLLSLKLEHDENPTSSTDILKFPSKVTNVVDVEPSNDNDESKSINNDNPQNEIIKDAGLNENNFEGTTTKASIKRTRSSRLTRSGKKKIFKGNNNSSAPGNEGSTSVGKLHRRRSSNRRYRRNRKLKLEYASDKKQKEFHSTFKNIPEDEKLFTDFACALLKEILLQGRVWISENHISFHSNILSYVTNLAIPLEEIVQIEKKFTAGFIPNALQIRTLQAKYFFTSFISRDTSFEVINKVWTDAAKSRISIKPDSESDFDSDSDEDSVDISDLESNDIDDDESEDSSIEESDFDAAADSGISDSEMDQISDLENMTDGSDEDSVSNNDAKEDRGNKNIQDIDGSKGFSGGNSSNPLSAAEETDSNGLGLLPVFGPLKHAPTRSPWVKKNNEIEIRTETFSIPPGSIYMLLFGDSSGEFLNKVLSRMKNGDISDIPGFKKNPENDLKERKYTYIKPLGGPVGPKQTKCNITETIEKVDLENDGNIQVLQVTHSPDVPSGNSFLVYTRFYLSWAENNGTLMQVITWVEWSGKSWIKSAVENGSIKGQKESIQVLVDTLNEEIANSISKNKKSSKKSSNKKTAKKSLRNIRSKSTTIKESTAIDLSNAKNNLNLENIGILEITLVLIRKIFDLLPIPFVSVEIKGTILIGILIFIWLIRKLINRGSSSADPIFDNYILIPISSSIYTKPTIKGGIQKDIWKWIDDRVN